MATSAVARETVFALRRKIAKIEGRLAERLGEPSPAATGERRAAPSRACPARARLSCHRRRAVRRSARRRPAAGGADRDPRRRDARCRRGGRLRPGARQPAPEAPKASAAAVDRHLGDLPRGRLSLCARDCARFRHRSRARLLFAQAPKLADALWIAEEAARLKGFSAVLLEMRGNPDAARSHGDPAAASPRPGGRPAGLPAAPGGRGRADRAPVRLVVSPRPPGCGDTFAGPLAGLDRPARLHRRRSARAAPRRQHNSRWSGTPMNALFRKDGRRILSLWFPYLGPERILRQRLGRSWRSGCRGKPAARRQPPGQEHPAHRRPRRAG